MSGAGTVNNKEVVDPTITGGTIDSTTISGVTITTSTLDSSSIGATTPCTIANIDNIQINGNTISSTNANGDINITPNGIGNVVLDGLKYPQTDGTASQVLKTDGAGQLSWMTPASGGYTFPYYAGTYYHHSDIYSIAQPSSKAFSLTYLWLSPFNVVVNATFTHMSVVTIGTAAGKTGRFAIYNTGANGFPGTLRENVGTFTTDAAAQKVVAITNTAFTKGLYWLAVQLEDNGVNLNGYSTMAVAQGARMNATIGTIYAGINYALAYATAFPDLTGQTMAVTQNIASIAMKAG